MDRHKEGKDTAKPQSAAAVQDDIEPPGRQHEGRKEHRPETPTSQISGSDLKRKMTALLKEKASNIQDRAATSTVSEDRGPVRDKKTDEAQERIRPLVIEPVPGSARYPRTNLKIGPNIERADKAEQTQIRKYSVECGDHLEAVTCGMIPTLLLIGAPHFRGFLGCYCCHYRNDGMELVATFGSGAVKIMTYNGWVRRTLKSGSPYVLNPMMTVRYHPKANNIVYAGGCEGRAYAFNTESSGPREQFCYQQGNSINALDISIDGTTLMTVGNDAAVRSYDPGTKQVTEANSVVFNILGNGVQQPCAGADGTRYIISWYIKTRRLPGIEIIKLKANYAPNPALRLDEHSHCSRLFAVRRHPLTPSVFVTGGWDNRVMIWDVRIPHGYVNRFIGAHICGEGIDIHENLVMTASWTRDRSVRFWDLTASKGLDPLPIANRPDDLNKGDYLYHCQFFSGDPTGTIVMAGGSGIKGAMILDRRNCTFVGIIPLRQPLLALDTYNNKIVVGGVQNTVKIGELRYFDRPPPEQVFPDDISDIGDDEEH